MRVLDLTDAVKCACPAPSNATIHYRDDRLWPITTQGDRRGDILFFKCKRSVRLLLAQPVKRLSTPDVNAPCE